MDILLLLFSLTLIFGMGFFFTMSAGGTFLITRLKSRMPFWKGKGKHILFFDRSGKTRFYYLIPNSDGKITINKQEYILSNTSHSFQDYTGGKGTIHFIDGEPLYIVVQGCLKNVLAVNRDYDLDIGMLNKIDININKVMLKNDLATSKEYINKLAKECLKLTGVYVYLRPARNIVADITKLGKINLTTVDSTAKANELLETYKVFLAQLRRLLETRNNKMINFDDYFSTKDLNKMFNDQYINALNIKSIEQERFAKGIPNLAKAGGAIVLIAIGILAFLLINQGTRLDEMNTTIVSMNSTIKSLNEKLDTSPIMIDVNGSGNPIPINKTDTNNT